MEPGRLLSVSHSPTSKPTLRCKLYQFRIFSQTASVQDIFKNLNENICNKLESIDRGYVGDNLDPMDWADLPRDNDDSWNNPIRDTRMYQVDYFDGFRSSLSAYVIAVNLFTQNDDEGNKFVLLDTIADHRVNGKQLSKYDNVIMSMSGGNVIMKPLMDHII